MKPKAQPRGLEPRLFPFPGSERTKQRTSKEEPEKQKGEGKKQRTSKEEPELVEEDEEEEDADAEEGEEEEEEAVLVEEKKQVEAKGGASSGGAEMKAKDLILLLDKAWADMSEVVWGTF